MFCKFCGKELQDGEVCGCAGSQQAAAAQAQQTSGAAQAATDQMSGQVNAGQADAAGAQGTQFNTAQMQQKANEYMQQGMEAAGNAWKNLLGIFKSPAQEGRAYVAESDMTVSLILIVLQAVIAGLFGLICRDLFRKIWHLKLVSWEKQYLFLFNRFWRIYRERWK